MANRFKDWYSYIMQGVSNGDPLKAFQDIVAQNGNDPEFDQFLRMFSYENPAIFNKVWEQYTLDQVSNGNLGNNDAYAQFGSYGVSPSEETSKYLDNQIAQQNTAADRAFQTQMRDSSLTSAATQLSQLGLSPSNVISVGGASSGVSSAAANQSLSASGIGRKQQLAINQYNQRMGMAKNLISMAGSMASSGIYGHALGAAKHSASALAAAASHSGLNILKQYAGKGNGSYSSGGPFQFDKDGLMIY